MPWNPKQYERFKLERSQPFYDLCDLVICKPGLSVIDLGCGTGELTATLLERLPESEILGIDSSTEMLMQAKQHETSRLHFEKGDQAHFDGMWDLVISNAALQWSDDHPNLFATIWQHIKPGGQLAIQMPNNHNSPAHQAIRKVVATEPFVSVMDGWDRVSPVLAPERYAEIMYSLGAENIRVHERIYPHVLENSAAVLAWIKGTALVPYFERIGEHKTSFIACVKKEIDDAYSGSPVFYPFKRVFISANKPENN